MGRPQKVPAYRQRVIRGREVAILSLYDSITRERRDITLGDYGTVESRQTYARLIAEWEARGRQLAPIPARRACPRIGLSVAQVAAMFLESGVEHYSAKERNNFEVTLGILIERFGDLAAEQFGPNALREVRQSMATGAAHRKPPRPAWCRNTCNSQTSRIRSVFKWAAAHEILPASIHEALRTLEPLKKGRTVAPESKPVRPVAPEVVDKTLPLLQPPTQAMVQLQRLTGMRPGEVVIMRTIDLDMTGPIWSYTPTNHKTEHHGHERSIPLGPQAQSIVRSFLRSPVDAYLFNPSDAMVAMQAARHARRKTAEGQGNEVGSNRSESPKRKPGDHYTVCSYRRAIERAAAAAGVANWHPHQLRHLYATEVRRRHGVEAARVALGHRHVDVTEIYAERDHAIAVQIAVENG